MYGCRLVVSAGSGPHVLEPMLLHPTQEFTGNRITGGGPNDSIDSALRAEGRPPPGFARFPEPGPNCGPLEDSQAMETAALLAGDNLWLVSDAMPVRGDVRFLFHETSLCWLLH